MLCCKLGEESKRIASWCRWGLCMTCNGAYGGGALAVAWGGFRMGGFRSVDAICRLFMSFCIENVVSVRIPCGFGWPNVRMTSFDSQVMVE